MFERTVSGITLTLLLIGMLALAFNIQPVKASGTIYIRADGSVEPEGTPISSIDNITYTFTDNIYDEIVVERDNIVVDGAGYTLQGTGSGYGIDLTGRSNVTIKNMEIKCMHAWHYGIWLNMSSRNVISGNNITNHWHGIELYFSSNNAISGNNIANNVLGIVLYSSSSNNAIFHNNLVNNSVQVYTHESFNVWDNGYPSGGNYWSDHVTVDDCCGINQDELGSDGIVDEPYIIDDYNCDNYPLVKPWSPVISATVDIDPDTLNLMTKGKWITCYIELPEGYNVSDIDVSTVMLDDTVPVSLLDVPALEPVPTEIGDYDNDTIPDLMVKFNRTEVASWVYIDLGIEYGNVTLTITGEVSDGTLFEGTDTVKVLFPGDVDDNGDVDSDDLYLFAGTYGTSLGDFAYKWAADFNEDGNIDSEDFYIIAGYYGKTAV